MVALDLSLVPGCGWCRSFLSSTVRWSDRADHRAAIGAASRRERRRIQFLLAGVTESHGG